MKPVLLAIMDGFGLAPEGPGNAVSLANTPYLDSLFSTAPHTSLGASGEDVGLPAGQMGNSEVGHLNIGAGRVVYQELSRINRAIADGSINSNRVRARRVVVAACADGARLLKGCGHACVPPQPVLGALATETGPIRGLSGVRVKCRLSLRSAEGGGELFSQEGELLFRDYGISGIVTFNASRFAQPGCRALIDLMPASTADELCQLLRHRSAWAASYEELMQGVFHNQVNRAVMRLAGCKPSAAPREEGLRAIAAAAKGLRLRVEGPGDPKHAQVTRGGAALCEFNPETLESRLQPGLFACG